MLKMLLLQKLDIPGLGAQSCLIIYAAAALALEIEKHNFPY